MPGTGRRALTREHFPVRETQAVPLAPPLPACGERSDSERSEAERWNPGEGASPRIRACGSGPPPPPPPPPPRAPPPPAPPPPPPAGGGGGPGRRGPRTPP